MGGEEQGVDLRLQLPRLNYDLMCVQASSRECDVPINLLPFLLPWAPRDNTSYLNALLIIYNIADSSKIHKVRLETLASLFWLSITELHISP